MPKKAHKKADHLALLRKRIAKAPTDPGVYRWLDEDGDVLYVGKAKNLRNRLKSYVEKTMAKTMGPWKIALMERARDFSCTITNTELEALILETNLIKENKPKYNVLMKDDKNYVYVRVAIQESFPSVEIVRRMTDDGARHFGPYTSALSVRETLAMLRKIFPYRTCKMDIAVSGQRSAVSTRSPSPESRIPILVTHRDRPTPCLDHHIHQCSAPCIGTVTPEEYRAQSIDGVINFLKGDYRAVHELQEEKEFEVTLPRIGVMVEVPATIIQIAALAQRADFISIGSNDLTQYLLAVDRNNTRVADLYSPYHPSVLRAVRYVVNEVHRVGKTVSICGEMAGDPGTAILLMAMGFDSLSMSASALPGTPPDAATIARTSSISIIGRRSCSHDVMTSRAAG